jgi:hypothetical protein
MNGLIGEPLFKATRMSSVQLRHDSLCRFGWRYLISSQFLVDQFSNDFARHGVAHIVNVSAFPLRVLDFPVWAGHTSAR